MNDAAYTNNSFVGDDGSKRLVHFFERWISSSFEVIYILVFLHLIAFFVLCLCFFASLHAHSNGTDSYDRQKPVELQTKAPNGFQTTDDYEPYAHRKVQHPLT